MRLCIPSLALARRCGGIYTIYLMFNIVLVAPEIPQNSGNIGRLCVNTGSRLHLVEPLGFSLDEPQRRRAGLDYWQHLDVRVHADWPALLRDCRPERMLFLSTKGQRSVYDVQFDTGDYLVFGNETSGLPSDFYVRYVGSLYTIPMPGEHARSLNLANAVAVVLFEALRQVGVGDV